MTQEQLEVNSYPMADLPVFADYIKTTPGTPTAKNGNAGDSINIRRKIIAMDCEMVRTCKGLELARLSIVDFQYKVIYDHFVTPENPVEDYLTKYSGITAEILKKAKKTFKDAQQDFLRLCSADTILVGHSLENDLNCLGVIHTKIIDTSVLFQNNKGFKSSLKSLSYNYLHADI
mmetsp:Transcript_8826/g.7802  ORF Transcript_8826/g.7802 Transcript_8826/m.7802 type:complete len:175 (+) Transcript_8826:265-789(+)